MTRLVSLFLVLLLVPSGAVAQSSQPEAETPSAGAPPPLVAAPAEPVSPPPQGELIPRPVPFAEPRYGVAHRLPLELLGGAVGLTVGLLPGGVLLYVSNNSLKGKRECGGGCPEILGLLGGALLVAVGAPVGMAAGITAGGKILEGQGHYGAALLGLLAGGFGGYRFSQAQEWGRAPASISVAVGALAGGIFAYELSHQWIVERQRTGKNTPFIQIEPMATLTQVGGLIGGIVGRF